MMFLFNFRWFLGSSRSFFQGVPAWLVDFYRKLVGIYRSSHGSVMGPLIFRGSLRKPVPSHCGLRCVDTCWIGITSNSNSQIAPLGDCNAKVAFTAPSWMSPKIGVGFFTPQNGWFIIWKTLFFNGWFGVYTISFGNTQFCYSGESGWRTVPMQFIDLNPLSGAKFIDKGWD